jgi:hypothetical protein
MWTDAGSPLQPAAIVSKSQSWILAARHSAQLLFWNIGRIALLGWGVVNGFGVGLVGQVRQRISRRVPRVSGSIGT